MQKTKILVAALAAALGAIPASAQSTGQPTGQAPGQWRTMNGTAAQLDDPQGDAASGRGQRNQGDRPGPVNGRDDVGVARVSVADGDVEVLRGDTGDRMAARGGMPLGANDTLSTGRSSRAEVQLGPGNLVRLNEESRIRVMDVGNRYFRLEVLSGTVNVSQLKGSEADIDVLAPNTTVRPLKAGVYRVTVRDAQTDLIVRKGEAEVVSGRGEKVKSGQRASVRGSRQDPELRMSSADPKDSFDRWNERRDDVLEPRYRTGGGVLYGGYGGYGYPYWGPGFGLGYGYGGFYGGSTVIIGGRGGFGGGHGGRGRR